MLINLIFLLTFGSLIAQQNVVEAVEKKHIVCYHASWAVNRKSLAQFNISTDMDTKLCTHLIYAFFGVTENGDIAFINPIIDLEDNNGLGLVKKFNSLKLKNPPLKTLASIGGWNAGSSNFSIISADPLKRAKFVQTSIDFIRTYGFNGIDLDWEYPGQRHELPNDDRRNFIELLKELKQAFTPGGYILTAAVAATAHSANISYDIQEMSKYLDIINIMSYNLHGHWINELGLNSPLHAGIADTSERAKERNIEAVVKYWLQKGAPPNKLTIGISLYGRTYALQDPNKHYIGAPHNGQGMTGEYFKDPGILSYMELCQMFKKPNSTWHLQWENQQKAPYAYSDTQWISYENETSIGLKVEYVKKQKLGGIMIWTVDLDDFRGTCNNGKFPFLRKVNQVLYDPPRAKSTGVCCVTTFGVIVFVVINFFINL